MQRRGLCHPSDLSRGSGPVPLLRRYHVRCVRPLRMRSCRRAMPEQPWLLHRNLRRIQLSVGQLGDSRATSEALNMGADRFDT